MDVHAFFDGYRTDFARYDAPSLAERFAYPLHVVGDGDDITPTVVATPAAWAGVLEGLLGAYRRLGVAGGEPLQLHVGELTPRLASATVRWRLRRQDGSPVYEFTAVYTLAMIGAAPRIAAIAHDELPKLQAALRASG